MDKRKTLILIDGHALAFRSFFALERTGMKTSDKEPTWAVFGFFKAIFDLLKNTKIAPDCIAVTFDVSHDTFRTECYQEYKANREQMPDTMKSQMGLIMEGLEAFNIPIYTKQGFEADDVIGTIADKATKLGHKTIILTGDQDAFQLIDREGNVSVLIPSKGELVEYDWARVYNKLGVYPDQVIDYKALRGDTSDNIPGIKGIGEKTAAKLLDRFQTLDNVLAHIDEVEGKSLKEKLKNGVEDAKLSYYLATIKRDVDIDFDFDKTKLEMPDVDKVSEFLKKVQFFSFLKNLPEILRPFSVCSLASKPENIDSAEMKKQQIADQKLIDFISLKDGKIKPNQPEESSQNNNIQEQHASQQQLGLFAAVNTEKVNSLYNDRKTIVTKKDFEELLEILKQQTLFAMDTETTSVNALEADLVGISLAYNEEIKAKDLINVSLYPLQAQNRVPEVYSMGNVCIVSCRPGTGKSGMPSKTWAIMATGTPIIASFDIDSEMKETIDEAQCGICVEPGNPVALAEAICKIYQNPMLAQKMGENARQYVMAHASKSVAVSRYITQIEKEMNS